MTDADMQTAAIVSVVIAMDAAGNVKRAYYSSDAALIIETANVLRVGYDVTTINCELIKKVPKPPRVRRSRAKESEVHR